MGNKKNIQKSFFNEDNIRQNILPYFNIYDAEISLIKFKNTDKQRAVYKVNFNNNTYCLKKIYFSEAELLYVYSALEWLSIYEINVPKFLKTSNGMPYLNYNNILFILTPWINGYKCDFDNYAHLEKSAVELAKFHRCSQNFKPIDGSFLREGYTDLYDSMQKHYCQLLDFHDSACKKKDTFSKRYIEYFNKNLKLCKQSLKYASMIRDYNLSKSLCHGDYVNKNIIFSHDDLWIIDFDKCENDYCAHDLSYLLRRLLKREKTNWNVDLTFKILYTYNLHKELSKSDLLYITSYLAFPQKFWKTSHDYYKKTKAYSKEDFLEMLEKSNVNINSQTQFINDISNILINCNWNLSLINKTL